MAIRVYGENIGDNSKVADALASITASLQSIEKKLDEISQSGTGGDVSKVENELKEHVNNQDVHVTAESKAKVNNDVSVSYDPDKPGVLTFKTNEEET